MCTYNLILNLKHKQQIEMQLHCLSDKSNWVSLQNFVSLIYIQILIPFQTIGAPKQYNTTDCIVTVFSHPTPYWFSGTLHVTVLLLENTITTKGGKQI